MAGAATPAIAALVAAKAPHQVLRYRHDPRAESFGDEAVVELAESVGVAAEQIFKTLVIAGPKGLAVAVLPVPHELSLKAAAAALGVPRAVDSSAMTWDRVLCSAGKRGLEVALAPADLVRLTNAVVAEILAT